jgi:hypothetical protein
MFVVTSFSIFSFISDPLIQNKIVGTLFSLLIGGSVFSYYSYCERTTEPIKYRIEEVVRWSPKNNMFMKRYYINSYHRFESWFLWFKIKDTHSWNDIDYMDGFVDDYSTKEDAMKTIMYWLTRRKASQQKNVKSVNVVEEIDVETELKKIQL